MMYAGTRPGANVRAVVADLVQAGDAQIARVVAMVDGMPDRGAADALIAPLRGRLAQLRPARPFNFTRLLFSPLDPVIMPGARWRRGEVGLPRPALAPLSLAVKAALPALGQTLEASAGQLAPDDRLAIASLGNTLWPQAADVLARMPVPADWTQAAGLNARDFAEIVAAITPVLQQAYTIEKVAAGLCEAEDATIRSLLSAVDGRGGLALATMTAILVGRLPTPAKVMALVLEGTAANRIAAADGALEHTLAGLRASMADGAADHGDVAEAAAEAGRVASLLSGLEEGGATSPERRRRLEQIRHEADALCRRRFDRVAAATLEQATTTTGPEQTDEMLMAMENNARDLRRLETTGRKLGGGEHYDSLVQTLSARFSTEQTGLDLADRVRMVEILAGPDEALALLLGQAG